MVVILHVLAGFGLGLLAVGQTAAADTTDDAIQLDPVTVTAPRLERPADATPAAIDRVDRTDVAEARPRVQLEESLQRIPGLYLQNRYNFAQNQRISTRGFGARAPFGVRGIRVRIDGIPETLPDGQSQLDTIDPDVIDRIEVIRGPASALYGNASGGVIDIHTLDGASIEPAVWLDRGSHGYSRTGVRAGGYDDTWDWAVGTSILDQTGYREQSEVERRQLNARMTQELDAGRSWSLLLSAVDQPVAGDPGGLTRAEVRADRRQAAPMATQLDARQEIAQQRVGLRWRDESATGALHARIFWTQRDFEQQLPFPGESRVGFDRDFYGTGVDYDWEAQLFDFPLEVVVGAEVERQVDRRVRFRVSPDGVRGEQVQDERQMATGNALFGQAELGLRDDLHATAGLRADRIRFHIDDRATNGDADASGRRQFDEMSHWLGLSWAWAAGQYLYVNRATAFETPTFTEFANPQGGGFNPDIEPQQALNHELGLRGHMSDRLRYQLALFNVQTRDEIVPFEEDGRTFYENAAKTERRGLEAGMIYDHNARWRWTAAWTLSDFRFRDFTDRTGENFHGNRLPGLPREHLYLESAWRDGPRHVAIEARHGGRVFAENANETEVDSYTVVNLRTGLDRTLGGGRALRFWLGVDNLFETEYFANIRINANPELPAANRRYFEPAPGRTWYAGVQFMF